MNEITRQAYVKDCEIGLKRWNRLINKAGYDITLNLPSTRFRRNIGMWANINTDPNGKIISKDDMNNNINDWLPSNGDKEFINSLMVQVTDPDKTASWIASPIRGINNLGIDYKYVDIVQ